jgi:hypothetical protein
MGNDVNCHCQALDPADAVDSLNMLCIVDLANGWPLIRGFRTAAWSTWRSGRLQILPPGRFV